MSEKIATGHDVKIYTKKDNQEIKNLIKADKLLSSVVSTMKGRMPFRAKRSNLVVCVDGIAAQPPAL